MDQCKNIFLGIVCLLAITVKAEAQKKCTECPALSHTTTIVCPNGNCSVVASGCKLLATRIHGNPKITGNNPAKPFTMTETPPGEVTQTCPYPIEGNKTITFTVQNKK